MNIKNYGLSLALVTLVAAPFAVSGCSQVGTQCIVGPSESAGYAVLYKLKSQTGMCPSLEGPNKGGTIGMEDFHPPNGEASRDLTQTTLYVQTETLFFQQSDAACASSPDPSSGYKGGNFTDPSHPIWSIGKFRDYLPDANNFCYVDKLTTASQSTPEIPAANPAPTGCSFSPGGGCTNVDGGGNPDGSFSDSCICAPTTKDPKPNDCCDTFLSYCSDDFTACTGDDGCKGAGAKCTETPFSVCTAPDPDSGAPTVAPDPNTGKPVVCETDKQCAVTAPTTSTCHPRSVSFCANVDSKITNCAGDDDCCPADAITGQQDPACLSKVHTCMPTGPDLTTCHSSAVAAVSQSYTWSNMKFVNTSAVPGTQFSATVTYSDATCQSQVYEVVGLWPSVSCALTGADGATAVDAKGFPTEHPIPDDAACCPTPEVAAGHPSGSGINPNFPVHCDHDLLICVLDTDVLPADNGRGYPQGCPKPQAASGSED
jgi:hypothetical protein